MQNWFVSVDNGPFWKPLKFISHVVTLTPWFAGFPLTMPARREIGQTTGTMNSQLSNPANHPPPGPLAVGEVGGHQMARPGVYPGTLNNKDQIEPDCPETYLARVIETREF
jgi:hypothetical protein